MKKQFLIISLSIFIFFNVLYAIAASGRDSISEFHLAIRWIVGVILYPQALFHNISGTKSTGFQIQINLVLISIFLTYLILIFTKKGYKREK